jgi:hypothetical protein
VSNRIDRRIADGKLPRPVEWYGGLAEDDVLRISASRECLLGSRRLGLCPGSNTHTEKNQQGNANALCHSGTSFANWKPLHELYPLMNQTGGNLLFSQRGAGR